MNNQNHCVAEVVSVETHCVEDHTDDCGCHHEAAYLCKIFTPSALFFFWEGQKMVKKTNITITLGGGKCNLHLFCPQNLGIRPKKFENRYVYMCWMVYVMRTAFCSDTSPHKKIVEPIAPPSRLDPKSSRKTYICWMVLVMRTAFCDNTHLREHFVAPTAPPSN